MAIAWTYFCVYAICATVAWATVHSCDISTPRRCLSFHIRDGDGLLRGGRATMRIKFRSANITIGSRPHHTSHNAGLHYQAYRNSTARTHYRIALSMRRALPPPFGAWAEHCRARGTRTATRTCNLFLRWPPHYDSRALRVRAWLDASRYHHFLYASCLFSPYVSPPLFHAGWRAAWRARGNISLSDTWRAGLFDETGCDVIWANVMATWHSDRCPTARRHAPELPAPWYHHRTRIPWDALRVVSATSAQNRHVQHACCAVYGLARLRTALLNACCFFGFGPGRHHRHRAAWFALTVAASFIPVWPR